MFGGIPQSELDELNEYWTAFPKLREELFTKTDIPYVNLSTDDIKEAIMKNVDVINYKNTFLSEFGTFSSYMKSELLDNMESINATQEETELSNNIFNRLENIPLIDKYEAYQLLDDAWEKIAADLEIVQTEGFDSTKKVDPNIVLKKKDGKDMEIQEGWVGHVIPFELVQETFLKTQYDASI